MTLKAPAWPADERSATCAGSAHLEPFAPRAARVIAAVAPLGDDAFEAHVAGCLLAALPQTGTLNRPDSAALDIAGYCRWPRLNTSAAIVSRRWRKPGTVLTSPRSQAITSPVFSATSKTRCSIRLQSSTDI